MPLNESIARGLAKRQHRQLQERIQSLRLSKRERRGVAVKENIREVRRVFGDMILIENAEGAKKKQGAIWVLLDPIENGRYLVEFVKVDWSEPIPMFFDLMSISQHAMQRLKQKEVNLRDELGGAAIKLALLCFSSAKGSDFTHDDFLNYIGSHNYELYTATGYLPLIWADDGCLLAPTWIADSWCSNAKQKAIGADRAEGEIFTGKSTKEIDDNSE